ncbi:hypothetical protein [Mesorhizobium sp. J428]|uniref:hypothetical protein n=1 Tax=Mesorhizobium sp. J428 TaxID=2898440 RepID=UPI0021512BFE|nr:hypothetical protein [Mesorhizobium sp. J428]MCR5857537.1 hypothetical protein [Mesorhizobium sp. J428]
MTFFSSRVMPCWIDPAVDAIAMSSSRSGGAGFSPARRRISKTGKSYSDHLKWTERLSLYDFCMTTIV